VSLLLPDSNEFADVRAVVAELVAQTHIDPDNLLLIGARCRDLLHRQLGHTTAVRGTDDVDIAVAVDSLADYRAIVGTLKSTGSTEARFMVGDFAVDIWLIGRVDDVVGAADETTGQAVVAFVMVRDDAAGADAAGADASGHDIAVALRAQVTKEIGSLAKPRSILVVSEVPKKRSGKIMRRLLRDVAEHRPVGDVTTLADSSVMDAISEGLESGKADDD